MEKPHTRSQSRREVEAPPKADAIVKAAATRKHTKRPRTHNIILCVDPDSSKTAEYGRTFSEGGWEVEAVPTLKEAVGRMKQVRFDCIVMDVDLPDMAGFDAVPIVKALDPGVNIVVTAGTNTKELEGRVRREDIFYYYIKSFDVEELKLAVRSAITAAHRGD